MAGISLMRGVDSRIISVDGPNSRSFECRSYYDAELDCHFALIPPGDDKNSRIKIPCSVHNLTEEQFCELGLAVSGVYRAQRVLAGKDPFA